MGTQNVDTTLEKFDLLFIMPHRIKHAPEISRPGFDREDKQHKCITDEKCGNKTRAKQV